MTPIEIALKNSYMRTAMYLDSVLRASGKRHKLSGYMKKLHAEKSKQTDKKDKELSKQTVNKVLKDLVCATQLQRMNCIRFWQLCGCSMI